MKNNKCQNRAVGNLGLIKGYDLFKCDNCTVIYCPKEKKYDNNIFEIWDREEFEKDESIYEIFFKQKIISEKIHHKLEFLDFGCAVGNFIKICREKTSWRLTGIDIASEAIEVARSRGLNCDFYSGDGLGVLKKLNKKFDIIFCAHALEHVDNPRRYISELKKYLNEQGLLYIELPSERWSVGYWLRLNFSRKKMYKIFESHPDGHRYLYNKKSAKMLTKGIYNTKIYYSNYPPLATIKDIFKGKNTPYRIFRRFLYLVVVFWGWADRYIIFAKRN